VTRRTFAAAAACAALAWPAGAFAQEATTSIPVPTTSTAAPGAPTTTAPGASTTTTTTAPPVATTTAPAPAPQPAPAATPAPAQAAAADDRNIAAIALLFVVAAALLLVGVLAGLAHWQAWEPPWLVRWRHATGEAGWRAGNAWAEFTDWLRLGR
jgi:hypothetical protein